MAELKLNAFVKKHKNGICINLSFSDYFYALKRQGGKGPLILTGTGGKELPTPNVTIRALAKKMKGDWVLKSVRTIGQHLILSDQTDAENILKMFPGEKRQYGLHPVPKTPS
jgi:hypothetical protein